MIYCHRAHEMTQWVNACAIKPDHPSSTPRAHMVEEELILKGYSLAFGFGGVHGHMSAGGGVHTYTLSCTHTNR